MFGKMKSNHMGYSLDAPGPVAVLLGFGLLLGWGGWFLGGKNLQGFFGLLAGALFILISLLFLLAGLGLAWGGLWGKKSASREFLKHLHLTGRESLLDAGCGRGRVLIEAAKKLPKGRCVGIDNWSEWGLLHQGPKRTLLNGQWEGVRKRVRVLKGDMRSLPFPNHSFDRVAARMSLHQIRRREDRKKAIGEMARILKKGGRLVLADFQYTRQYTRDLRALGFRNIKVSALDWFSFPPARLISADK
jgi:SAM-dependent methyltransferase